MNYFNWPNQVQLNPNDIHNNPQFLEVDLHEPSKATFIRLDIAQAQLDTMRVAKGIQHDAKWHELYRALNMVVARIGHDGRINPEGVEYCELMSALVEIDNGVYIEPDKWSVL